MVPQNFLPLEYAQTQGVIFLFGGINMKRNLIRELKELMGKVVKVEGYVHKIRVLKYITFIVVRDRSGLVQCVAENSSINLKNLKLESVVSIVGEVKESKNSLNPFEISINKVEIISEVKEELPIEINKENLTVNLDTMLDNRVLSLRNEKKQAIFKVQNIIVESFREFLANREFTEIFTPKIVAEGAEGGTEVFEVKYFENKAYLAQSPQFYKQMMVSVFERVFEVGQVYRAEEHNTNRHLNEYVSMDLEFGYIEDENDLMELEEELLKYIFTNLKVKGEKYFDLLNVEAPVLNSQNKAK